VAQACWTACFEVDWPLIVFAFKYLHLCALRTAGRFITAASRASGRGSGRHLPRGSLHGPHGRVESKICDANHFTWACAGAEAAMNASVRPKR
jgi:hypothetical protein